jgi:DNA-binding MarR family transcriptional regulator/GNAT superfamily N-acetyltransferase
MATMLLVAAVRAFNRFYTQKIGVLQEGLLASSHSLTEVRVLWELAHRQQPTATDLAGALGLDAGYLSRLLRRLETQRLLTRRPSLDDRRQSLLGLTARGRRLFATLDSRSERDVARLVGGLDGAGRRALVASMQSIEKLLGGGAAAAAKSQPYLLRGPQPGDLGWIVHRHGVLYAEEYGWDARFEALVAEIVGRFVARYDRTRERCFVAERDGAIVGSVFVVARSRAVAKLRLLYVEPSARGLGIGARLVDECIRFARQAGYRRIELWTNSVLSAARRIYERAGFVLVDAEPHHSFGKPLVAQTYRLDLKGATARGRRSAARRRGRE